MTLYSVSISGRQYQVEIGGGQVRLNGQPVSTGLLPLDHPGLFRLTHAGHQRDLYLNQLGGSAYAITTDGRQLVAEVEMAGSNCTPQAPGKAACPDALKAPMPGVVVSVTTAAGEAVNAGQLLVTLESMKMQMEFRAPMTGKVVHVAVQPGQKVEKGALLVQLEK